MFEEIDGLLRASDPARALRLLKQIRPREDVAIEYGWRLGCAQQQLGDLQSAERSIRNNLQRNPHHAPSLVTLGQVLLKQGRPFEALGAYELLEDIHPESGYPPARRAEILWDMGKIAKAEVLFRRAVERNPSDFRSKFALSELLLSDGQWEEGWALFEERHSSTEIYKNNNITHISSNSTKWISGAAPHALTIVSEQGLGDTIQFLRYVLHPSLNRPEVTFLLPRRLEYIAKVSGVRAQLIFTLVDWMPRADEHWVALMSLPMLVGPSPFTPIGAPYLPANPRARGKSQKLGIVWQGNPQHPRDAQRSVPQALLRQAVSIPGVEVVSLQRPGDAKQPEAEAFRDVLEALPGLDFLISIDSAVAHVAGAAGHPVLLLLCSQPDWRWGRVGDRTAWYDKTLLFRSSEPGWTNQLNQLNIYLRNFYNEEARASCGKVGTGFPKKRCKNKS